MLTIAIDGPSGVGKSSTAQLLAKKLNILHLNTGALYRAVAVYLLENSINPQDEKSVENSLNNLNITVSFVKGIQQTLLNEVDITNKLYTSEIGNLSAISSSYKSVRSKMVQIQRNVAQNNNVVMEGRDIASNVLPNAKYKFFLTASPEIRAKRRYNDLIETGEKISFEEVYNDVISRDEKDTTRTLNPLKITPDAIVINTDNLTLDQTVEKIISYIKE